MRGLLELAADRQTDRQTRTSSWELPPMRRTTAPLPVLRVRMSSVKDGVAASAGSVVAPYSNDSPKNSAGIWRSTACRQVVEFPWYRTILRYGFRPKSGYRRIIGSCDTGLGTNLEIAKPIQSAVESMTKPVCRRSALQAQACYLNRDQMSYSACQTGPSVSNWFQWCRDVGLRV
jgi:hypothetical protein